jgi:gas vesicle protein
LRERTGGLYTPTADSRGLQYAEQGRAMGINEELKTLVQLAKSEGVKGTGAETEIKNAIRAVQEFGVDKIAKIQVAQAAGTGVPKDLIDIATQLKSPTQQRLSEIAPDLKESLAQIMETGEPQVDALNSLNAIQANSFQALVNIETSIAELVGLLAPEQDNSARNPDVFDQKIVQTPRTSPEVQYVQSNKQAFDNARSQGPQVDLKNNFNLGSITLNVQDSARFDAEFKDQMDQLREQVKTLAEQQGVKFTPTSSRGIK